MRNKILQVFFVLSFIYKVDSNTKILKKIHGIVKDNNDVLEENDDSDKYGEGP